MQRICQVSATPFKVLSSLHCREQENPLDTTKIVYFKQKTSSKGKTLFYVHFCNKILRLSKLLGLFRCYKQKTFHALKRFNSLLLALILLVLSIIHHNIYFNFLDWLFIIF